MSKLFSLCLGLLFSAQGFAQGGFTGTREHPKALTGTYGNLPYQLFVFEDHSYDVVFEEKVILSGAWSEDESTLRFGRDGLSNKVTLTENGGATVCLEAVFKRGPELYRFRTDVFCPKK